MTEPDYKMGMLFTPHSDDSDDSRTISYRFVDEISGEMKVMSGNPLREGETYMLAVGERNRRIEVVKEARRSLPDEPSWTEYLFRIV